MKTTPLILCLGLTLGLSSNLRSQDAAYVGIQPGFDFPATQAELLAAVQAENVTRLREHGWKVFAGLTQPARPQDPNSEAIWETWYRGDEVFVVGPQPQGGRKLKKQLRIPRQFQPVGGGATPQAVGESQLSSTLFNAELRQHTRANGLTSHAALTAINDGWTAQTPIADRKVIDYPKEAMSLKLVWLAVRGTGMTTIPIWDEQAVVANAPAQDVQTWPRSIVVDPSRETVPTGETATGRRRGPGGTPKDYPNSHVVPLKSFYHFKVSAEQATEMGVTEGDFFVLMAMHYTTKEIPNWVWGTLWWHDRPDDGPFAKGRLPATEIKGPWRNYLMDVSYDMTVPKETDDTPNAVFNPWLEARFINGVNSNCMTCHQRALWPMPSASPPENRPWLPVTRGAAAAGDPLFRTRTKLDFLWSLALETPP
jgi:hypothetical protein